MSATKASEETVGLHRRPPLRTAADRVLLLDTEGPRVHSDALVALLEPLRERHTPLVADRPECQSSRD